MPPQDHPFNVRDEIELEPISPSLERESLNKIHSSPGSSKTTTKRIQLNKVRSYTDLSRADDGPSYGLPENDSRQSDVVTQGSNEEPMSDDRDRENHFATKTKEGNPESIDISSLSLGINPEEITILKEIFQGECE